MLAGSKCLNVQISVVFFLFARVAFSLNLLIHRILFPMSLQQYFRRRSINPKMNSSVTWVVLKEKSRPNRNRHDVEGSVSPHEGIFAQTIANMKSFTDE